MKTLVVASLLAFSSSLLAMPNIGDTATYAGLANGVAFTVKSELTSFDSAKALYTKVNTTTYMGQSQTESEELTAEDLMTDETINTVLSYCETSYINGKLQTLTVPTGTFNTCAISNAETGVTMNLGAVPFGIVKLTNGQMNLELTSYKIAQ